MLEKIVIEAAIRDNKCAEGFAARMLKKKKSRLTFFSLLQKRRKELGEMDERTRGGRGRRGIKRQGCIKI